MRIGQYLTNPLGKGATFPNIIQVKKDLQSRYDQIRKIRKFEHYIYKKGSNYVIHVIVPSESIPNFGYDVVISFESNKEHTGISLEDMDMKMFSNSPSFIYTYAHVFRKDKLFFEDLRPLIPKEVSQKPEERNPYQIVNFEKTIYMALLYIKETRLTLISNLRKDMSIYHLFDLRKKVRDFDSLMKQRGLLDNKLKEQRKKQREHEKRQKQIERKTKPSINNNKEDIKPSITIATKVAKNKTVSRVAKTKKAIRL